MIEHLKSDALVEKVGGRFQLCALIQRRMVELMEGARPLIERDGRSDLELAVEEIVQDMRHEVIDDLVDTGKTLKVVREMLPKAHYATVYAKPVGVPMVDTFITEVSQDTWIYFPWDMGWQFQPPLSKDTAG